MASQTLRVQLQVVVHIERLRLDCRHAHTERILSHQLNIVWPCVPLTEDCGQSALVEEEGVVLVSKAIQRGPVFLVAEVFLQEFFPQLQHNRHRGICLSLLSANHTT